MTRSYDAAVIDEIQMNTVTISPKFQVVIPKEIRARLKLRAGQKVHAMAYDDRIELVPVRPAKQLKGFLRGSPQVVDW
jgi:AbrB family looped-hinge helix DNA binding protein